MTSESHSSGTAPKGLAWRPGSLRWWQDEGQSLVSRHQSEELAGTRPHFYAGPRPSCDGERTWLPSVPALCKWVRDGKCQGEEVLVLAVQHQQAGKQRLWGGRESQGTAENPRAGAVRWLSTRSSDSNNDLSKSVRSS